MNNEERDDDKPQADDVEGHRIYSTSDRNIKDHVEPVAWDDDKPQADDVEGHLHSGAIRPDIHGDAGRTP